MALENFLSELKRRHVYRAGAAYAVAAFVLIEIVGNLAPILDLPAWIARGLVLLLIVGFPVTLLAAWMIESRSPDAAPAHPTARVDYVLAGALLLVIALIAYDRLAPSVGTVTAPRSTAAGLPAAGSISIAVLPFVNLSSDPEQEFFSDGMTEEITSALAKVKALRVVGRTSAFEFKGQNKDLRAIGQALGASHLLEGSIRKEGNQIRVTAQLIRAEDGTHIWTDNYDRELKSVFAIQDEISQAIAGALQVPLGLNANESLVVSRAVDPEGYQQYLTAKAIIRARGRVGNDLMSAVRRLEQVVDRNPNYAPAWAALSLAYNFVPQEDESYISGQGGGMRRLAGIYIPKGEAAARRATELDPSSADAHAVLGVNIRVSGKRVESEEEIKRALALDPMNPDALHFFSQSLASAGKTREALPIRQQLQALEPFVPIYNLSTARILLADRQYEAALAVFKALPDQDRARSWGMAQAYAALGRYSEAADAILTTPAGISALTNAEMAAQLLRKAPAPVPSQDLPDIGGRDYGSSSGPGFVYLYVGATDKYIASWLANFETALDAGYLQTLETGWYPWAASVRKTERFKAIVRKMGLVDYWRARGWPDHCRPVGADDFECE